jgi:anti-sigma regulatory factor (Ser/Thr protein kinase)
VGPAEAHRALFYRGNPEYLDGVWNFVAPALGAGEPVAIAVPPLKLALLRDRLGELHYVGEPIWPGRSSEEIREATRHEALINLAWPAGEVQALCPYDAVGLESLAVPFETEDLGRVRRVVANQATAAGLGRERVAELMLAVNELTTNTVKHAGGGGMLRVWTEPGELICQVEDDGLIGDPLAGRTRGPAGVGGLGLWMVNQLCDLVEVRTGAAGSTVRVHAR